MQQTTHLDALEAEDLERDPFEPDVQDMLRRLASHLDRAIDTDGPSCAVVAEALMRLALGVYLFSAGAAATRDRLLTLALHAETADRTH